MAQEAGLSLQLFASGFCEAHANVVNPKEGKGKATFYALWALLHIPERGYVLFDTGYSEAFKQATQSFPARFYRWATPVTLSEKNTAKNLLEAKGIAAEQIKYVIISHFHADHIAGLKDFAQAQFICTKAAFEQVQKLSGFKAVSKGILHDLLPENFNKQIILLEEFADQITINPYGFTEYQLFGLNQFKLVWLPGHAKGMLGFIYQDHQQAYFYATDAAWHYDTYKRGILPRKIVKLFFDSWADYLATLQKIQAFELANPAYTVLFTHCPRTLEYVANEL
jgi:glyoxylase-like metal-dependent hydrolase (beta-lactamase superfamily II)